MPFISEPEFTAAWNRYQQATKVAEALGITERNVYRLRRKFEAEGKTYNALNNKITRREHRARADLQMRDGTIVVFSDAHYWPGVVSTAHKALLRVLKKLKPDIVVANGDLFDGASISRFPASSWGKTPSVKEELDTVKERLGEISKAAGNAQKWWCIGNHDMRFETRLCALVPQYEGVSGFSLQEQFPDWPISVSLFVNENLMIKHRYHNGVHATYNNALKSGVSMVTGHLHRLQAAILSDYKGARWGVDTGTLAGTDGEHMSYGEDNPMNHCSGFAVLTVVNGQLIHPEFCGVVGDKAYFRGAEV